MAQIEDEIVRLTHQQQVILEQLKTLHARQVEERRILDSAIRVFMGTARLRNF
jgi:hypothetical protein